jgi:hypothetical protein
MGSAVALLAAVQSSDSSGSALVGGPSTFPVYFFILVLFYENLCSFNATYFRATQHVYGDGLQGKINNYLRKIIL